MNSFKELILLRADRDSIILLRDMLLIFYYKPFATELNELCETKYEFNMDDKESYEEEINECADQHLRYLNIEIKLKELELEHAKNEKGNEVQNNESEFYILLIELSDHAKIHLTDQISMFEFAQRVNRLQEYINKSKPSNNGSKPE